MRNIFILCISVIILSVILSGCEKGIDWTSNNKTIYIDDPEGKVGIGTSNPRAQLHIKNDFIYDARLILENGANNIKSEWAGPWIEFRNMGKTISYIKAREGYWNTTDNILAFNVDGEGVLVLRKDAVIIPVLNGTGNAYACLDKWGRLYRSETPCVK